MHRRKSKCGTQKRDGDLLVEEVAARILTTHEYCKLVVMEFLRNNAQGRGQEQKVLSYDGQCLWEK